MANGSNGSSTLVDCTQLDAGMIERVNYFPRQLLTADDMFADQDYFRLKLQRHNRFMHGWGTVCGLLVTPTPTQSSPWLVQISTGYALGPYGDEIYVGDSVNLDLASCGPSTATNPCNPGMSSAAGGPGIGATIYIAIEYSECMSRPISVTPAGCGCEQTSCENSRIRDSFTIQCLTALPSSYQLPPSKVSMCDYLNNQEVPECPACPSDPWVVLAAVNLPASSGTQIAAGSIDNFSFRRQLFSVAILQNQIAECCCAPAPTPTPTPPPPPPLTRVTSINFTPGEQFPNVGPSAIKVTFSQPVLRASLTQSSYFVTSIQGANVAGSISFDDTSANSFTLSATFTPSSPFFAQNTFTVTVAGSSTHPVTDLNNVALDGNSDGFAGGNYTASFSVFPVIQ
jgi:hypothetical protein